MGSPPAFIVRAATPADAAAILQVHRQSILLLGLETYSLAEVESWAAGLVPERYVEAMNEGGETFIVAAAASGLVGICSFKDDQLMGLSVIPDWARRGVGSALLRQAESAIAAAGYRIVRLDASLSGQAFYEHHGYRVVVRHGWKTRGGLVIGALAMEKALSMP